jgi:hypothetical protein
MTFAEAHERLDVIIDKHDLPWFEPEEKDVFLQFAQNEFVKSRYAEFEVNEKRRQDLRTLISTLAGSGTSVTVPVNMLFVLSLKGTFSVTKCGITSNRETFIRPVQHDDVNKIKEDPFNKPNNENPVYVSLASSLSIESDSSPSAWTLTYLREPTTVNGSALPTNTFDLPVHTHEEIINIAVRKMLFSIDKETYQLQINEILNQE